MAGSIGFCLDNENRLIEAYSGDPRTVVKTESKSSVSNDRTGTPITCTAVMDEDCTATLQCTWQNDFRMVVDSSNSNVLYLTDDTNVDYGVVGDPTPIDLVMHFS